MKMWTYFLLTVLLPRLAYAQSSVGAEAVQRSPPSQSPGADSPVQGHTGLPLQAPNGTSRNVTGLTVAVGLGYGVGFGALYRSTTYQESGLPTGFDTSIGGAVSGLLPLWISLGFRPISSLSFGVVLATAPLFVKHCGGPDCAGSDRRIGGELRWHLLPGRRFSPWISTGFGYEWFSYAGDPAYFDSVEEGGNGFDFAFQIGGDVAMTSSLTLGPYVELRRGSFGHLHVKCRERGCIGMTTDYDIPDAYQTSHEWLTFGMRGTFTFPLR